MPFNLTEKDRYDNKDLIIKDYYSSWRSFNKGNKASQETFAIIYSGFKEHMNKLDAGSLKLYLYFSFHAKNEDGFSYHGIQTIAEFFGVSTRTVDKWIKILIDHGLIYREKNNYRSSTTYLLPYSTTLMELSVSRHSNDSHSLIGEMINKLKKQEDLFGPIINIFHLFQWSNTESLDATQWVLIVTRRSNGVLTGHYHKLLNSDKLSVNKKLLPDHLLRIFEADTLIMMILY